MRSASCFIKFLLLFCALSRVSSPTTPVSLSALNPLLLSKLFLGEQLKMSAPWCFLNGGSKACALIGFVS